MKTGDFDLGQKMKILNFLIWNVINKKGLFDAKFFEFEEFS